MLDGVCGSLMSKFFSYLVDGRGELLKQVLYIYPHSFKNEFHKQLSFVI